MATYNLFVKLLDGKTLNLRLTTSTTTGESIRRRLFTVTGIPTSHQLLVSEGRNIYSDTLISAFGKSCLFSTVHLLLRLIGGKGGFGSLLRGAATKAGQKKTNNFDACRDMSGRRLRHVNAEKKLEEWQAEADDRRMEKIAEEFIKKKAKTVKRGKGGEAEKYVEKYREESKKCVEVVEASVRESFKGSKRKAAIAPKSDSKKLKIWMGKNKLEDSDSDDMDEEGSGGDDKVEDNEKSVVLDSGNHLDSIKEDDGSSSSVSCGKAGGECSAGASCESGSEEEKEIVMQGSLESCEISNKVEAHDEVNGVDEPCAGAAVISETEAHCQLQSSSCSGAVQDFETIDISARENWFSTSKPEVDGGIVPEIKENIDMEKPLNFDEFNSATEMEALGMERLKSELQAHGLKCGGTLQERAARLFLLKTTPLEMLPKKLLAKK